MGLIANEHSWHQQALCDLNWIHSMIDSVPPRPAPTCDGQCWTSLATDHPGTWKRLIKKARTKTVLLLSINEVAVWHSAFYSLCAEAGVPLPTVRLQNDDALQALHGCIPCKRLFTSKAAWSVHCFKKHSRCAPQRRYADGQTCDVCGKFFLNHVRLGNHIKNNTPCFEELRRRGVYCQPLPGINSRAWRQAQPWSQCPYIQTEGPRFFSHLRSDDFDTHDFAVFEDFIAIEDKLDEDHFGLEVEDWIPRIIAACNRRSIAPSSTFWPGTMTSNPAG